MLVIIPSGAFLSKELSVETGCSSHGLINLGGKPLILHILKEYQRLDPNVTVILVVPDVLVEKFRNFSRSGLKIVGIECSNSIAHSVLKGLNEDEIESDVIVHMADTLITLPDLMLLDTVFTSKEKDLYRWTSLVEENGIIRILHDREPEYLTSNNGTIAVGVFSFSNGDALKSNIKLAISETQENLDPFFVALRRYSQIYPMSLVEANNWYDFGHLDKYYESKLLYQNLRHFNYLAYDQVTGKVTKTSNNIVQFRNQVRWFKQVPDDLCSYYPRIYDSSDGDHPFITMELLPFPTLSELFIYKRISIGSWNPVLSMISTILEKFNQYMYATPAAASLAESIYKDKTLERLNKFIAYREDALSLHVVYKGAKFSLINVFENLDNFIAKFQLTSLKALSPIHGDFCFSNLLYDNRSGMIKMIDARGEFGVPGIYGDPKYDLAKLFHSIDSGYDFIIMDNFNIDILESGEIILNVFKDEYHQNVNHLFEITLLKNKYLKLQVKAIQALLFLSMLPLHQDKPKRQTAMLNIGLFQFAKLLCIEE